MRSLSILNFIFLFYFFADEVLAEFNRHFADFVEEHYGQAFLDTLQRTDIGDKGSFGGKNKEDDEINNDPVIFVHGVSDFAGGKMKTLAASYKKNGYTDGELYATTYDNGPRNNPISWADYSLKCEHVKQIRTLILAVRYYTLRDVDIVAYSLGVPIARKAVLGGECVDTKEDLGAPLTQYVDSFIGIAGPNHGISLQVAGVPIPGCVIGAIPILPICSKVIGLYSGFCPTESSFLTDINDNNHYEGQYVYSIFTDNDNWIGYKICDEITAKIPGEDGHKLYRKYSHDNIVLRTSDMQIQMIQNHTMREDFGLLSRQKQDRKAKSEKNSSGSSSRKREIQEYNEGVNKNTKGMVIAASTKSPVKLSRDSKNIVEARSTQSPPELKSDEGYHTQISVSLG